PDVCLFPVSGGGRRPQIICSCRFLTGCRVGDNDSPLSVGALMTFVEAAIEVLKREGKPQPVKRLAELAVKHNLPSVVGRDAEGTMQLGLADATAGRGSELVEVRPGVYGLRSYPAVAAPAQGEPEAAKPEPPAAEPAAAKEPRGRRRRGKKAPAAE